MDPSDWFQGTMSDDGGLDSSSPLAVDMLACSRPLMERRLRPPHDQAIKCPRCESIHTKFCYYNNYSLSQPRYFCKTCRRYWTKGGTLRNIPVGGGCRKNKKSSSSSSSKKPSSIDNSETSIGHGQQFGATTPNTTDLQLSFPQLQLPHHLIGGHSGGLSTSFLDNKYNALLDRSPNVDFLENKFGALASQNVTRGHDLLGSSNIGIIDGVGFGLDHNFNVGPSNLFVNNIPSSSLSFGVTAEGSSSGHVLDNSFQRLMLPYDYHEMNSNEMGQQSGIIDMKPSTKLLTLEWQGNTGGASENKDSFGYNNGLSSWGGSMLNGYTPSTS